MSRNPTPISNGTTRRRLAALRAGLLAALRALRGNTYRR